MLPNMFITPRLPFTFSFGWAKIVLLQQTWSFIYIILTFPQLRGVNTNMKMWRSCFFFLTVVFVRANNNNTKCIIRSIYSLFFKFKYCYPTGYHITFLRVSNLPYVTTYRKFASALGVFYQWQRKYRRWDARVKRLRSNTRGSTHRTLVRACGSRFYCFGASHQTLPYYWPGWDASTWLQLIYIPRN